MWTREDVSELFFLVGVGSGEGVAECAAVACHLCIRESALVVQVERIWKREERRKKMP